MAEPYVYGVFEVREEYKIHSGKVFTLSNMKNRHGNTGVLIWIPKRLCEVSGIRAGDEVLIVAKHGRIIIVPASSLKGAVEDAVED
ncbi:MAG: AbrB/MazE/SpoVT family DNA-binding domain-containing protein [Nitrososphaerota archaeon]